MLLSSISENELQARASGLNTGLFSSESQDAELVGGMIDMDRKDCLRFGVDTAAAAGSDSGSLGEEVGPAQPAALDSEMLTEQEEEQEKVAEVEKIKIRDPIPDEPLDPSGMTPWRLREVLHTGFEAFTTQVHLFQAQGVRVPSPDDFHASMNHTRPLLAAERGKWLLPKKLRDSIVMLTVTEEGSGETHGALVNLLERGIACMYVLFELDLV